MSDESFRTPLLDDPSVPPAVRRLLSGAPLPGGIPDAARRAGRQALARGVRARSGWRLALGLAFASLLMVGVTVAASKPVWLWQPWRTLSGPATEKVKVLPTLLGDPAAVPSVRSLSAPSAEVAPAPLPRALSVRGSAAPPVPLDTSLDAEVAALREARAELATNPARALSLSREHAVRFPKARLGAEAKLLEVEALVRLGRHEEARSLGQRLLAAPGASLYRERLETLLGGGVSIP